MPPGVKPSFPRDAATARLQELHEATLRLLALLGTHKLEDDLLRQGIEVLTVLIEARYGAIAILNNADRLKQFVYTGITPEEASRINRRPEGHGLLDVVLREGHVLRLDDISKDPRAAGFPPYHPPMKSLLAAPIAYQGRVCGRVYLSEKINGEPFTDNDELLTKYYADVLALILAYHRAETGRAQAAEMLQEISRALSATSGDNFFPNLVLTLSRALDVDYVFVGEFKPRHPDVIRTVAFCDHGRLADNIDYHLAPETPCGSVECKTVCHFPEGVHKLYPEDDLIHRYGVEAFIGHPLLDSTGRVLGLLVAMHEQSIADKERVSFILRLCANRAAAEIERRRAEKTMRESEERFRTTFNQAAMGIAHVAPDGRFLRINQKFCDIVGYTQEEMLERTFQDITHPDDLEVDLDHIRQMLAGAGQTYSMEKRYFRKDGSTVWVNLTVSLVRDEQNTAEYFISVVEDISGRKQAEAETRKLASAVEQTADSVVITDSEGVIQYVNPAYEAITGYTREEAIGKKPNIVKSGEHNRAFYERLWSTILRGEMFHDRLINRKKDGSLYYEEKTITPLKDANGRITRFVSTGKDITERVRAEEALAKSAAEWVYATDFMEDPLYLVDLSDKLVRANRAFYQFTGLTPEKTIGRDITSLMHPHGEALPCPACLARKERRDARLVREADDPTNPTGRPIETRIRVVRAEDGEPTGILVAFRDLTPVRQTEAALRASEASLRQAQRIAHLGNWDWNILTNELRWSDEVYRIFGLSPQQLATTYETFLNLVHPDDRQFVIDSANKALHERESYSIDHRIVRPDGTVRVVHGQAEVTFDENGKAVRLIGTVQDVTEYRETMERLNFLANYDTLTGLPNRLLLQDRLHQSMIEVDRNGRLLAAMVLDLDRFKVINDTLGHDVGDALLKAIAERLMACVRNGDTISHAGGDEFTIILANVAHADDTARVAEKIKGQFLSPFRIAGHELFVSASIGIALYPLDDRNAQALLKNAEAAMYHAKALGRNTYQFYTAELNMKAKRHLDLETALCHALERNELHLHYQPQVNLNTGRILGSEALLRWQHPEYGAISPMEFIPLAEETGLILPIGEWVLRTACAQARAWRDNGFRHLQIAVNLSGRQFQRHGLAKLVHHILNETGLPARQLELEVTETFLMHNISEALTTMNELHALGVVLSMDDFGTGYSSLSHLKRFPLDTLKIDRSFVRDIPADPNNTAIVQAIIAMAHSLGIRVIAEGVETAKQFDFLHAHRCHSMQGYYFSKPLTADGMTKLLRWDHRLARRKTASGRKTNSRKKK